MIARWGTVLAAALAGRPETPRPFTSMPIEAMLIVLAAFGILGFLRALLPWRWSGAPARFLRGIFAHALRLGWLAFVPALVLDGLIFFLGERYDRGWAIAVLFFAFAPFAAGLQWEKSRWNPRKKRQEPYPLGFNYYVGLALVALVPALLIDAVLARLAEAGRLPLAALPLNLLALGAIAASAAFGAGRLLAILLRGIILPHRMIRFFLHPSSRYYAFVSLAPLAVVGALHYLTLPFFLEVFGFCLPPVPAVTLDQVLIILIFNLMTVTCVLYFSIFSGVFISMLPLILFSRALRRTPERPPTLDELIADPERSRAYLGRTLSHDDVLPTIVTVTAYNEPADPLEKTLAGYLRIVKAWLDRGLPPDKYIVLFSHQTEREEERIAFDTFLAVEFPDLDPRRLIERDWRRFDEDAPGASIVSEASLDRVLEAWLRRRGLDPASKAAQAEVQKRRICQRMVEFSIHAPRELFGLPDPPPREYGGRPIESWIWYYLIPKEVGGRPIQVTSKAHNLYYAREAVHGRRETSPLARDGIFRDAPEWLYDASDADAEIHPSCVEGILSTYTPFYREPRLGWIQRLSYTIEPRATFLSSIKSASEVAYWSWYLRVRIHTYTRRGKPRVGLVGGLPRPIRRDFQSANGHNMVVRGTSIREAGGDIEHERARVSNIRSPLARWLARLRGREVRTEEKLVEKWVPTGEDLELATRMALQGYYGDYAPYAPQGEGSPADFRGNIPQAIRWSGNNVQLLFMHLARLVSSPVLTFNEKMGYFMNLATLASAPLLYLTVLRAAIMPFLDVPDVYASMHRSLAPVGLLLALAPNFLLFALALAGQLVRPPSAPWQRTIFQPWHRRFLLWIGCLVLPPASILFAAMLPGWLAAAGIAIPAESAWVIVGYAIVSNAILLVARREVYANLAYTIVMLPFLQILYLAWIIFGIMGTLNMIVKTQIVEPYISRLAGTSHPPEAGAYPADASGRFLSMNRRFPLLFLPLRWLRRAGGAAAVPFAAAAGIFAWHHPLHAFGPEISAALFASIVLLWLWKRLPGLLDDWFLDPDSLANRWWDYWTNPQPAFVKTLKEREERSFGDLLKDNVFGLVNGVVILFLIVHVHFVNAADFSAALLAYLTFSIAASWVISPFFYEEPHRTLRSHGKAVLVALLLIGAFLAIPLGLPARLHRAIGIRVVPEVLEPWLIGALGIAALGGIVNLAPWGAFRAFAKRFALGVVMLALLFLSSLTVSYRGIAVQPLQEDWARRADAAFVAATRALSEAESEVDRLREARDRSSRDFEIALVKEALAIESVRSLRERDLAEARRNIEDAASSRDTASLARDAVLDRERARAALAAAAGPPPAADLDPTETLESMLEIAEGERARACASLREAEAGLAQADVTDRLRRALIDAEDLVARIEVAIASPDARSIVLSSFRLPPLGDVASAETSLRLAEEGLEGARRAEAIVLRDIERAEAALRDASASREEARAQAELLRAQHAGAVERSKALASRREHFLQPQVAERALEAYRGTPRRYEAIQKALSSFRSVLESPESRDRLLEALEWVASFHPVKRIALEGATWYPRRTLLSRIRTDLPAAIAAVEEAEARTASAREEAAGRIRELLRDAPGASVDLVLPRRDEADPLPGDIADRIRALRDAVDEALEAGRADEVPLLFGASSPPPAPGPALLIAARDIRAELTFALTAARAFRDRKEALESLEDRILVEIDRLEPYLIGQRDREDLAEAPPDERFLLLRTEKARLARILQQAHERLANHLIAQNDAAKQALVEALEPRRSRARADLLARLDATLRWVADAGTGILESIARALAAIQAAGAESSLGELYGGGAGGGLIARLRDARSAAARAEAEARRAPREPLRLDRARRAAAEAERIEAEARAAWERLDAHLAAVEGAEDLARSAAKRRIRSRTASEVDLASLPDRTVEDLLARRSPRDEIEERRRAIDARIAEIEGASAGPEEAERWLSAPSLDPALADYGCAAAEAEVASLRLALARLEGEDGNGGSEDAARIPAPVDPAESGSAPLSRLELDAAIARCLEDARGPGGALALADKDVERAAAELRRSMSRFLPEVFGTLGATSNVPAIFQGGGFGLVTLSLDLFENRRYFRIQQDERAYLRDVEELWVVLGALRAYGGVVAAEAKASLRHALFDRIAADLRQAREIGGEDTPDGLWLAFAEERLRAAREQAEVDLARARRALASLQGAPADDSFATGVVRGSAPSPAALVREAGEDLRAWLARAAELVQSRFPEDPAIRAILAEVDRHASGGDEARLRRRWPVLRAGAGLAAPNETPFGAGASLILPLRDQTADLDAEKAQSRRDEALARLDLRILREGAKRGKAEIILRGTEARIEAASGRLASELDALEEELSEYCHTFSWDAKAIVARTGAMLDALSEAEDVLDAQFLAGLDLLASGGTIGANAVAPIVPPEIAPSTARLRSAEAAERREASVIDRFGIGASASYSTLFIPLPALELTYGVSEHRRAAAASSGEAARAGMRAAQIELRGALLEAHLDWLRARALERRLDARAVAADTDRAAIARRLEAGLEPPLSLRIADARVAQAHADAQAGHAEAQWAADVRERWLDRARAIGLDIAAALPDELDRAAIDASIDGAAPFFKEYGSDILRTALEADERCRWLELVATLENKKPYGGTIGNPIASLWDLWRLWDRPGTEEEKEAALARLRGHLLRPETADAEALRALLDEVKDVLGGSRPDPDAVEEAIVRWRGAVLSSELEAQASTERRALADLAYRGRIATLADLSDERKRLDEAARRARASAAAGGIDSLRGIRIDRELRDLDLQEAQALHAYAAARAEQAYLGNPLDAPPPVGEPEREAVPIERLMDAYAANDPDALRIRALLGSRRREAEIFASLGRIRAHPPSVTPSVGTDSRYAGSSLLAGLGFSVAIDRYRHLDEVRFEIDALERALDGKVREAGIAAAKDALRLREARHREALWTEERDALARRAEDLRAEGAARWPLREIEGRILDAEAAIAAARRDRRRIEEEIARKSGNLAFADRTSPAGSPGDLSLAGETIDAWAARARGADPEARSLAIRAEGKERDASWRRREGWLGTRLEIVGSLGQAEDTLDEGGGGFLAIPVSRFLGLDGHARIAEIDAQKLDGSAARIARREGEAIRELALRLEEERSLLAGSRRTEALAARANAMERAIAEATADVDANLVPASALAADARLALQDRAGRHASIREELRSRLASAGIEADLPGGPAIDVAALPAPDPCIALARDVVAEVTAIPRGSEAAVVDWGDLSRALPDPGLDAFASILDDLRRTRLADAIARTALADPSALREEARRIDCAGLFARATRDLAAALRRIGSASPGALRSFEIAFRKRQLARAERELSRARTGRGAEDPRRDQDPACRLFALLREGAAGAPAGPLATLIRLREEYDALACRWLCSRRASLLDRDPIGRRIARDRAARAAASVESVRTKIAAEIEAVLASAGDRAALEESLAKTRRTLAESLGKARSELDAEIAALPPADPHEDRLAIDDAMEALGDLLAGPGEAARASLDALREEARRYRLALAGSASRREAARSLERVASAADSLRRAWAALLASAGEARPSSLREVWQAETLAGVAAARLVRREAAARASQDIAHVIDRLMAPGENARAHAQALLAGYARGEARRAEFARILEKVDEANRLSTAAERAGTPRELERRQREAGAASGEARARLATFFDAERGADPNALVVWIERAGLAQPSPCVLGVALRHAQGAIDAKEGELAAAGPIIASESDSARSTAGWIRAEREIERIRLGVRATLDGGEGDLSKGYADGRGALLTIPEIVARDARRAERAIWILAEAIAPPSPWHEPEPRELHRQLVTFLDGQILRRAERHPGGGAAIAGVAHSRTFEGRDESFTYAQALHAIASLLLWQSAASGPQGPESPDARNHLETAEALLRRPITSAAGAGHPALVFAQDGGVGDPTAEAGANAAVAIAWQLHAALTGRTTFAGRAGDLVSNVLLPLAEDERFPRAGRVGDVGVAEPLRDAALVIAALRNQAAWARADAAAGDAERFARVADDLADRVIRERWRDEVGLFQGASGTLDAEANAFSIAVLGFDGRFGTERLSKAVRAFARRFGAAGRVEGIVDRRAYEGNWVIDGPIEAYNGFIAPVASRFGVRAPEELAGSDAWLFLNQHLFDASGGILGFDALARGFAPDATSARFDAASTARGLWLLEQIAHHPWIGERDDVGEIGDLAATCRRELIRTARESAADPLARSWPGLRSSRFRGLLSTEPACFWIFAEAARRGRHPLLASDFSAIATLARATGGTDTASDLGSHLETLRTSVRAREARLDRLLAACRGEQARLSLLLPLSWLEGRIDAATDLIRTNEDPEHPEIADTYATALAIIHAAIAAERGGEADADSLALALRLWNGMRRVRSGYAWANAYDVRTGRPIDGERSVGRNAWMILAGLHLHRVSGDREIIEDARRTLDWILRFQDLAPGSRTFGALTMGEVPAQDAISVEHNIDALAATAGMARALGADPDSAGYIEAAKRIAAFLRTMWQEDRGLFAVATSRPDGAPSMWNQWLDCQTWSILALDATRWLHDLDPKAFDGLAALEAEGKVTEVVHEGRRLRGFAKITLGPPAFWSEGVAGHVLASRRVGRPDRFLADLIEARGRDGTLLHIIGAERRPEWEFDLPVRAIDGTVWAAWAMPDVDFNPFRTDAAPRPEPASLPSEVSTALRAWTEAVAEDLRARRETIAPAEARIREIEARIEDLRRDLEPSPR